MKKYDVNYEGGKCPMGYEYVSEYHTRSGKFVDAHCRKLRKHVRDDLDPGMSVIEAGNPFEASVE